jgi:hypothetical protein
MADFKAAWVFESDPLGSISIASHRFSSDAAKGSRNSGLADACLVIDALGEDTRLVNRLRSKLPSTFEQEATPRLVHTTPNERVQADLPACIRGRRSR